VLNYQENDNNNNNNNNKLHRAVAQEALKLRCVPSVYCGVLHKKLMWVTVCCYCEITTTVNTLTSVFILVAMYSMIAIYSLSKSDVFTSVSPLILRWRRAALVKSGRRYSREKPDSIELAQ
jgi:hypothetical protein